MKFYQAVQNLLVGDRQTGDMISLLSVLEGRPTVVNKAHCKVLGNYEQVSVSLAYLYTRSVADLLLI
jgi:hypothetical protein